MFEIELFICIKMDLALNNLKRLICHKNQPNKQSSSYKLQILFFLFIPSILSCSLSLSLSLSLSFSLSLYHAHARTHTHTHIYICVYIYIYIYDRLELTCILLCCIFFILFWNTQNKMYYVVYTILNIFLHWQYGQRTRNADIDMLKTNWRLKNPGLKVETERLITRAQDLSLPARNYQANFI